MNRPVPDPLTQTPHKGWTLGLASLGLFMVALDTLVVTSALPVLRVDLGAGVSDLEWTVNAYNLFVNGFRPAIWVAAGLSTAGIVTALLAPRRPRPSRA